MGTPFGTTDFGLIGVIMFMISIFVVTEFKSEKQPSLRIILFGISLYMMTLTTSAIGVMSFAGFSLYNLFKSIRG